MTSKDFCVWLRGYLAGLDEFPDEPVDTDTIEKKLDEVVEEYVPVVYPYYPPSPNIPEYPMWYQYPVTCSGTEITSVDK